MALGRSLRGFLGLLALESSWSFEGRQGLGFLVALSWWAPKRKGLSLSYPFNTNPYLASLLLKDGLSSSGPRPIEGLLAAWGDELFWRYLRPILAGVAVWLAVLGVYWAPLLFIVGFNLPAQGMRWAGIGWGRAGVERIGRWVRRVVPILELLGAVVLGMLWAQGLLVQPFGILAVGALLIGVFWFRKNLKPQWLMLGYLFSYWLVRAVG